ncbi:MAG TPA: discoidin domain-containing protein [Thermoanaerobaculia bacterium]|nr:discoidin domain-containing protein [Thermoanaerobaculia bacterium]
MRPIVWLIAALALVANSALAGPPERAMVIDDFETTAAWSPHPSDGVALAIDVAVAPGRRAMQLGFDFNGHAGYAIARRNVDIDLPENFEFTFWMCAEAPVNNLEVKLIDSSGENVWWVNRRDFEFPRQWTEIAVKKRQISFAWGPLGGGEPHHVAAIEIVVTAGTGGKGRVWISDLSLIPLPPPQTGAVTHGPWRAPDGAQQLTMDLGVLREIGGLRIRWDGADFARDLAVELSRDGEHFTSVRSIADIGEHARRTELIYLPDEEAKTVRLSLKKGSRGRGYAMESIEIEPVDWAPTPNDFFSIVAKASLPGHYPRYLLGQQSYWTVAGADGAGAIALLGEDGAVEPFKGGFSIEPFLRIDGGAMITWSDVEPRQSLAGGDLPIPSVEWRANGVALLVTAAVTDSSTLLLRYRLHSDRAVKVALFLAIRPFQVNPSTQFLNTTGGVSPIHEISFDGKSAIVNGTRRVDVHATPARFAAATFDQGNVVDFLNDGLPSAERASDSFGYASGAIEYPLSIEAGETKEIDLSVPLEQESHAVADIPAAIRKVEEQWHEKLHRVAIEVPGAPQIAQTIRTNLAYMLIQRHSAAIEPGSRSYDRAWIRDGSLIASVLLRLGHPGEAKAFAEWFAARQFDDGKVPCCVDRRGADPVPENDSHGELIFLLAEIYRTTHDLDFVRRLWPHVDAAARYIQKLRGENHGPFEGLVTESISHEGYSAKPVHSYWDDVFALKGLDDAAYLAAALGLDSRGRELAAQAATLRLDLQASMRRTIDAHHLDYIPASAELGDLDPTSTAIAISPLGLLSILPSTELRRTYDRHFESLAKPRDAYTPYEMRIIGALIRMGDRERALVLVDRFLRDRRPAAWNEWAEVVGTDSRKPRFIGDMPHSWIASDFIRSILDAFAFDREDGALVVGAGVPRRWIEGGELHIGPLATYSGPIDIRMRAMPDRIEIDLSGEARPERIIVRSPDTRPIRRAFVDGIEIPHNGAEVTVARLPVQVVMEY